MEQRHSNSQNLSEELARIRREQAERYRAATRRSDPRAFSPVILHELTQAPPTSTRERQIQEDEELARRLQAEEDALAAQAANENPPMDRDIPDFFRQVQQDGGLRRHATPPEMLRQLQRHYQNPFLIDEDEHMTRHQPQRRSSPPPDMRRHRPYHDPMPPLAPIPTATQRLPVISPLFALAQLLRVAQPDENLSYEELLQLADRMGSANRGASQSTIDALPTQKYKKGAMPADHAQCSVCLMDYEEGEILRTLPCLHCFHKGCIDTWIQKNKTCPVCKTDVDVPAGAAE